MLARIKDRKALEKATGQHSDYCVLCFWGKFSDAAQRALQELTEFAREYKDVPIFVIDVQQMKGVHKEYRVEGVGQIF
jgi:hypothetical protein